MKRPTHKDYYASVIAPNTKKIEIVSKRLGSKERLAVIATCMNESVADKIVEALNHYQGETEKLEAPAQKRLDELKGTLRTQLQSMDAVVAGLRTEVSMLKDVKYRLEGELKKAILERDAAQKVARETA